ncbi:hypothetical protein TB2_018519 [Malus domestica]
MSEPHMPSRPPPLYKQRSWSPDAHNNEVGHRRKKINGRLNLQRSKNVTNEDLDELKTCIELRFGFDSLTLFPLWDFTTLREKNNRSPSPRNK